MKLIESGVALVKIHKFGNRGIRDINYTNHNNVDHGGCAGMNCLRSIEHWNHGFESHSRHGRLCMRLFCLCVILCVGSGPVTD
jgi:hypothetical protein